MARTRVRRRRITLAALGVCIALALVGPVGHGFSAGASPRHESRSVYVVRPGDTLWSIARRVAPAQDPRAVMDAIAVSNRLGSSVIVPGESLVVPASP